MLTARPAAKRACPQRPAVRRVHSTPLRTAPSVRPRAPASARLCHRLAPFSRNTRIAEVPSLICLPALRNAPGSVFGLQLRIARGLSTEQPAPAAENKPAAAEKPATAEQPQAKPAAPSPDSTVLQTTSDGAESSNKKSTGDAGAAAPTSRSLFSRFLDLIRDNKGTIWMVLLINFIIWLNSYMLDTAEGKIAESLDYDLTDDERMFAWSSLKMMAQFQPPHADRRYVKNVRNAIFEGIADDVCRDFRSSLMYRQEPIIKEAALSVLTALTQTNEKVQRQVTKDLEQIGFLNLWERMGIVLLRTPQRTTTLGAAPGATDPLTARIRYKFTTLLAFLAANRAFLYCFTTSRTSAENHSTLVKEDYTSALLQMMTATAGSSNLLDRLARQDIAGTIFSLTSTEDSRAAVLKPELVNALVKLKEEGADNTEGARTLAAKALVNLAQLPGAKDAKFLPPLTPQDYELAKQKVEQEGEPERQSFWQWWKPNENEAATSKVLNFVKPMAFVASVAWVYGSLRTASYRQGLWRSKKNWKHAWTAGGGKATLGALSLMGLSMGFDMLISTPLEKKYHMNPAHAELTFFVLALPALTRKLPYCLAPVMGSAVYEIYQNYTEDFVPEQVENVNDLMDTTMMTMQLKDRIQKSRDIEAEMKAVQAARARAAETAKKP